METKSLVTITVTFDACSTSVDFGARWKAGAVSSVDVDMKGSSKHRAAKHHVYSTVDFKVDVVC